jgi:hypothetical protein
MPSRRRCSCAQIALANTCVQIFVISAVSARIHLRMLWERGQLQWTRPKGFAVLLRPVRRYTRDGGAVSNVAISSIKNCTYPGINTGVYQQPRSMASGSRGDSTQPTALRTHGDVPMRCVSFPGIYIYILRSSHCHLKKAPPLWKKPDRRLVKSE